MQFIVLDLEWNQALSGKPYKRDDLTLAGEIIQIGAVKLDDSMRVVDSLRIYVAPKYYKKMQKIRNFCIFIHERASRSADGLR